MVRDCTAMKSSYKAGKKKEKGDNHDNKANANIQRISIDQSSLVGRFQGFQF